jgi:hypothetical protein
MLGSRRGKETTPLGCLSGTPERGEDGLRNQLAYKEAKKMFSNKIRTTIIALVASVGFAGATVVPAVSQAQWHTIVVGGQVITHGNYTEGGVSPCTRISGQLNSAENLVGDDEDWKVVKGIGRAGVENANKDLEANEAAVLRSRQEAFEYGCDIAPA